MNRFSEYRVLRALLVLQGICALFFLWDGLVDLILGTDYHGWADPQQFEFIVALSLLTSLLFTIMRLRYLAERQKKVDDQLRAASGLFGELLQDHFDEWGLSAAEADVAMLAIKGLSISEIADIRSSREGTIKAQLNAVYRKASVTSRTQLLSLFIEELMGDGLLPAKE